MSSAVVERPSECRTAPIAHSNGTPMATSTYDGSTLPDVHAEPHDPGHVFGARAAAPLVFAAVLHGHELRAAADVETGHALRAVDLVARERQQIDVERLHVDGD